MPECTAVVGFGVVVGVEYPIDAALARMAAATGDRDALVAHLGALAKTKSMGFTFVRHEPMIQPWHKDPEVIALLDKLDAAPRRVA